MTQTTGRTKAVITLLATIALASAAGSTATMASTTSGPASTGVAVFVGYADSLRARGEFPNPWSGSPKVTFDGCAPAASCAFDAGAIRIYNAGTSPVEVNQVSAHIATCLFTWSGPMYPVALAPQSSLIVTQRATNETTGCTGPDPATFDSSDLPNEGCTNDNIQPVVDVTVDGVTTTATDSGQVLNTGGIDPGTCGGTNESTEWVPIGSKACSGLNLTLAPATQSHSVGTAATVSSTFANACGNPLSGVAVEFQASGGPNAGLTGTGVTDASGTATFTYSSTVTGTDTLGAGVTNAAGFKTVSNDVNVSWIIEFAPGGGSFVIGDNNAALGTTVNFWGAQWAKHNSLSGGPAPRSFKGFAEQPTLPSCGQTWSTDPGNSTPPPDGPLPELMAVIVASVADQSGSLISGNIQEIVLVRTDSGYRPNPGHAGMGTVISVICAKSSSHQSGASKTGASGSSAATPSVTSGASSVGGSNPRKSIGKNRPGRPNQSSGAEAAAAGRRQLHPT